MFAKSDIRRFYSNWKMLLWIVLPVLAVGCVRTTQPILKDDQVTMDDAVVGNWVSTDGKDMLEVSAPVGDDKDYKVVYTDEHQKKGEFLVRLGKVQDLLIAEIRPQDTAPDASDSYKGLILPLYSFLVVDQTTPQLVLCPMSVDWLKKYVDANPGELAVAHEKPDDFIVTASTESFQAFFLRHYKEPGAMADKTTFVHPGKP